MSISIDENIIAVFYCDLGPSEDYMMGISRIPEGIEFKYRVRHHCPESTDPFDGKDQKNWAGFATSDPDEDKAIEAAREMIKGLVGLAVGLKKITLPHRIYELIRGDETVEQFGKRLFASPFAHVQKHKLQ